MKIKTFRDYLKIIHEEIDVDVEVTYNSKDNNPLKGGKVSIEIDGQKEIIAYPNTNNFTVGALKEKIHKLLARNPEYSNSQIVGDGPLVNNTNSVEQIIKANFKDLNNDGNYTNDHIEFLLVDVTTDPKYANFKKHPEDHVAVLKLNL